MSDYIYLPDNAADYMYCSRCGEPLFDDFGRREMHEVWLERITLHLTCQEQS